jgi:hypothetical protein
MFNFLSHRLVLCALVFLCGNVGVAWSQDPSVMLVQQVTEAMQQSRAGQRLAAARLLRALAVEAERGNVLEAWAWAEAAVVEAWLDGQKEDENFRLSRIPGRALMEVIHRCEAQRATAPLSYVWQVQARYCFEQEINVAKAAAAWERAGSYALDARMVNQGITCWLAAGRIYRRENQLAHVQECLSWLELIARERANELSAESSERLMEFRKITQPLLNALQPNLTEAEPELNFQPFSSSVVVSSQEHERGRARFMLANHQTHGVEGLMTITAAQGDVVAWVRDGDRLQITLRPSLKPKAAQHRLRILPGEKLKIYVDYLFQSSTTAFTDQLQMDWTDGQSSQVAAGKFESSIARPALAQVTNLSLIKQSRNWPIPFYHEIFYRGDKLSIEDVLVQTETPGRVEIYNEDTGELLAIDAEGDGVYTGSDDFLDSGHDRDGDTRPEVIVGPKNAVGSLEIYVFPKVPLPGGTKVSVHMVDDAEGAWRLDAVDEQHVK